MRQIGPFIGGQTVRGTSGRQGEVFLPMTGEVQARVDLACPAEVRAAVETALAGRPRWAATNPQRRARVPLAYYTFGGWTRFNRHGPVSVRFSTRTKTVTGRWPSGIKDGANFVIPTMQ